MRSNTLELYTYCLQHMTRHVFFKQRGKEVVALAAYQYFDQIGKIFFVLNFAGEFKSTADYQYQLLRCNVDLLKIIQLGLTFLDETGSLPDSGPSTWQFNFKFNLTEDMYAEDSVDLLQNSGIQFEKHEQEGIDPIHFAEIMLVSGLVLREPVKWLSFHSGYDFGYLLNLLTNQNLPKTEAEFFELLKLYFPNVYDVKYLMKSCKNLKGGLQEVANELEVPRIGNTNFFFSNQNFCDFDNFSRQIIFDNS